MEFAKELNADLDKPMYASYKYDVFMERQASDLSDAIIWFFNSFQFVEVYNDIQPV